MRNIFGICTVPNLEADARNGNYIACFSVLFHDFNKGFFHCVIEQIEIFFFVFADYNLKILHIFGAFPALGLMNDIDSVGELFCRSIAVFIAYEIVFFAVFCSFIRA